MGPFNMPDMPSATENTPVTAAPAGSTIFTIALPPRIDGDEPGAVELKAGSSAVFLGSNGAGKTRLAGWFDKQLGNKATFIHALRSIDMPSTYNITKENEELAVIYAGTSGGWQRIEEMKRWRYQSNHNPYASNDFINVLNILGTRDFSASRKFRLEFSQSTSQERIRTDLDAALGIWSQCLPHLMIDASKTPELSVKRLDHPGEPYGPRDMSDGERAIFYLVAKCLIAPSQSTIIVDEPEMYVHASIRNQLWDAIEQERRDCALLYFTHDIDFAANRRFAHRYIISKCIPKGGNDRTENAWEYNAIAQEDDIPEPVLLNVLGSRQKVLFLEGDASSLDRKIASARYPGMQLRFSGACDDVIRLVKALRKAPQVHRKLPAGLIDVDFRMPAECEALEKAFIYTHKMREVENILVSEKVVEAVLVNLAKAHEAKERISHLLESAKRRVEKKLDIVARKLTVREVRLQTFERLEQLQCGQVEPALVSWPDAKAIEQECISRVRSIWGATSWDAFLSLFSARKEDFRDIAGRQMGFKNWEEAEDTLLGWLSEPETENSKRLRTAIAHYLPEMPID